MALARYQGHVTDGAGNVVPGAKVRVRRETAGLPLATLKADTEGATPLDNPVTADANGYFTFCARGSLGGYYLMAYAPGFERIWRNVSIGTAAQVDVEQIGLGVATNAHVDTLAERDDYDDEEEGWGVLVSDIGDGRAGVYTRNSPTPGTWAGPAIITPNDGEPGEDGVMTSIIAGAGIDVDPTDPANPIVTAIAAEFASGDYTPELSFDGLGVGVTYDATYHRGRYARNGDLVQVWVTLSLTSKGSSTGAAAVSVPFPARGELPTFYPGTFSALQSIAGVNSGGCIVGAGTTFAQLFTTSLPGTFVTDAEMADDSELALYVAYEAEPL